MKTKNKGTQTSNVGSRGPPKNMTAENQYDNPTFVGKNVEHGTDEKQHMSTTNKHDNKSLQSKPLVIILVLALIVVLAVAITVIVLYATDNSSSNEGNAEEQNGNMCTEYPCGDSCDMTVAPCNGLIFEDTFDTFRFDVWQHEITAGGGGNWEFQYYTNNRSNSYVKDNVLYIKPTLTLDKFGMDNNSIYYGSLDLWGAYPSNECTGNAWGGCVRSGDGSSIVNPIQSAKLRTVQSFSFTYGKVEVEAKMPTGDWIWPAIWMLPTYNEYGDWPASGEIDIMEGRGNRNLTTEDGHSVGVDTIGSTLHWGPFWPNNAYYLTTAEKTLDSGTFGSGFHKYGLEWTEDNIKLFVDDEEILRVDPGDQGFYKFGGWDKSIPDSENPWRNSPNKMAPFDKNFYLILNVAVGGTNGYFWDGHVNGGYPKPWSNYSPTAAKDFWEARGKWYPTWTPDVNHGEDAAMQVKSVRVWRMQ